MNDKCKCLVCFVVYIEMGENALCMHRMRDNNNNNYNWLYWNVLNVPIASL